jgi:hypothetical protein
MVIKINRRIQIKSILRVMQIILIVQIETEQKTETK